jgi:hypothetical protein
MCTAPLGPRRADARAPRFAALAGHWAVVPDDGTLTLARGIRQEAPRPLRICSVAAISAGRVRVRRRARRCGQRGFRLGQKADPVLVKLRIEGRRVAKLQKLYALESTR